MPGVFWTAVARRSRDTAFERVGHATAPSRFQSGAALRFPPHSKTARFMRRTRVVCDYDDRFPENANSSRTAVRNLSCSKLFPQRFPLFS